MSLNIFIESSLKDGETNESYFIRQYVAHLKSGVSPNIIGIRGKDNLLQLRNQFNENTDNGGANLIIFDCDSPATGGGIASRINFYNKLRVDEGLQFDCFFFPNNQDDGTFEDLLIKIINQRHKGLLECFSQYELCIRGNDPDKKYYELPNVKAKIYSYISSFKRSRSKRESFKEGNWDFENQEYWNLDDPYLDSLKEFLLKYL